MTQFLCKIAEIGENGKEVRIYIDSTSSYIMLFHHAGSIRAFLNVCPHQGRPLNWAPDKFLLTPEKLLICAHHGASFELETGKCIDGPCRGANLRSVDIQCDEDSVWLARMAKPAGI